MSRLRGLYAITDGSVDVVDKVALALAGGVRLVQYRDKTADRARRMDEATRLRALCHEYGALFLVNDDVALAAAVAADGVHLGRGDMPLASARQLLGPAAVIGATCHDALELADAAVAAGADYIAFGAFFPSATKPGAIPARLELIARVREHHSLPICAIGGITPGNGAAVVSAGADLLAVCRGLFDAADITATAAAYAALFP